jgi:hypothetical protein
MSTPTKKPTGTTQRRTTKDLRTQYATADDKGKAAILRKLRDAGDGGKPMSWKKIRLTIAPEGKGAGWAEREWDRYVGDHGASRPLGMGRMPAAKKAEPTTKAPTTKAPAKRTRNREPLVAKPKPGATAKARAAAQKAVKASEPEAQAG